MQDLCKWIFEEIYGGIFMENRNKKTKSRGNGEGTIYYSGTLQRWVAQYMEPSREKEDIETKKK